MMQPVLSIREVTACTDEQSAILQHKTVGMASVVRDEMPNVLSELQAFLRKTDMLSLHIQ